MFYYAPSNNARCKESTPDSRRTNDVAQHMATTPIATTQPTPASDMTQMEMDHEQQHASRLGAVAGVVAAAAVFRRLAGAARARLLYSSDPQIPASDVTTSTSFYHPKRKFNDQILLFPLCARSKSQRNFVQCSSGFLHPCGNKC